jgi:hypothetical protein
MATPDWIRKALSPAEMARARRAGRLAEQVEARAAKAAYVADEKALRIELQNGALLQIPVKLIPWLEGVAPEEIQTVEVLGRGSGLHWESLDLDLSVPNLVASVCGGPEYMSELGRLGGSRSSEAKAAAARRNGRKGGRPRKRSVNGAGTSSRATRR